MKQEQEECLFCNIPKERIISTNQYAYAVRDGFPVTELHTLVIPQRHVEDYFGLTKEELLACDSLLRSLRNEILESDATVKGFNIGMNLGQVAGQSIFHCHIHLIPRREGDVDTARGGVRQIIPGRGDY